MAGEGIKAWQLVRSIAGRDQGQYYLVVDVPVDGFALLADGDRRQVESAKRKNPRHLAVTGGFARELARKAGDGGAVTNAEIRQAIAQLVPALTPAQLQGETCEVSTGDAGGGSAAGPRR
jgi:ribosomal protein L14E/L6E/L27E